MRTSPQTRLDDTTTNLQIPSVLYLSLLCPRLGDISKIVRVRNTNLVFILHISYIQMLTKQDSFPINTVRFKPLSQRSSEGVGRRQIHDTHRGEVFRHVLGKTSCCTPGSDALIWNSSIEDVKREEDVPCASCAMYRFRSYEAEEDWQCSKIFLRPHPSALSPGHCRLPIHKRFHLKYHGVIEDILCQNSGHSMCKLVFPGCSCHGF